jgi:hypothetical protein
MYLICPDGTLASSFMAYCDQVTYGGGWMLFFSYNHLANQNNALAPNTLPTDETTGYSHKNSGQLGYTADDIQELRFYCDTSLHDRKVHFKTTNGIIKGIAVDDNQSLNTADSWNTGFTTLTGHTARIPGATNHVFVTVSGGFHDFPFYEGGLNHWGVRGLGSRWECDDSAVGPYYTTRHNVWVRMTADNAPTMAPSSTPSMIPSYDPSGVPSWSPSFAPSGLPSWSSTPSSVPSQQNSSIPSEVPS